MGEKRSFYKTQYLAMVSPVLVRRINDDATDFEDPDIFFPGEFEVGRILLYV